jgi:hypothetical protein
MKTLLGRLVVFALGIMTFGVPAVRAQIVTELDFKMTQSFTVGNTTLPAGSYMIRPVHGTDQSVIEISAVGGKPSVMVEAELTQTTGTQAGSQLIFNKYNKVLAVSQIFPGGGNSGYQLAQGHPEKLAAKTEKPTKQTVAGTAK